MRDESFNDDTPSTPVRAPLHLEDEDDLPTPTKLSPYAIRLNASGDSPTRVASTKAEVVDRKEGNAEELSYDDDDSGSVPVIPDARLELKEEKGGDGGWPIDPTTQQDPDIQTNVDQEMEARIKGGDSQAVEDDGKKVAITFMEGEAEEEKGEAGGFGGGFGDDFSQSEATKDNGGFVGDFGDDFDDFGEAVEGDDGFDGFEGFEEDCALEFSEPPTPVPPPPPEALVLPVVLHSL